MNERTTYYLTIAIIIVLFDVVASFVSKAFQINYITFALGSWALYAACGYFASRRFTFLEGLLGGAVAGLSDSTMGWAVSMVIGPYPIYPQPKFRLWLLAFVITTVTLNGAFFGFLGALLGKLVNSLKPQH